MTIAVKIGKDLSVKESCTDTHTLIYIEMITNKIILIMFVISGKEMTFSCPMSHVMITNFRFC